MNCYNLHTYLHHFIIFNYYTEKYKIQYIHITYIISTFCLHKNHLSYTTNPALNTTNTALGTAKPALATAISALYTAISLLY